VKARSDFFVVTMALLAVSLFSQSVFAQSLLDVATEAWHDLSPAEKAEIQTNYIIRTIPTNSYGLIVDVQGVDQSTPGSTGGSALGGAVASASYIDKSFNSGDYSAKGHLGAMLLGGLIGAALDSKPQTKYLFRYTVKDNGGNFAYFDVASSEPFRHSIGSCVLIPGVSMAPRQSLCTETADTLRMKYLKNTIKPAVQVKTSTVTVEGQPLIAVSTSTSTASSGLVMCRVKTLAPMRTTAQKCNAVNGEVLNDE
jgi:outer membrane lipoprotein SlyB